MVKMKKGQMKIQQMAFMLIAVTLFFVIAGLFVLTIVFSDIKGSAELIQERNALLLVSRLANSPEFACGDAFSGSRVNCVDLDKVIALKNNINDYTTLQSNFWGVDGIEIVKVIQNNNVECNSNNYPLCDSITLIEASGGTGVSNFISLCRNEGSTSGIVQDKCEIGRIILTYNE